MFTFRSTLLLCSLRWVAQQSSHKEQWGRFFIVTSSTRWDTRDLPLLKFIFKMVLFDPKEKSKYCFTATPYWWEPLTITIEGFWSIFYSLPFTNLGAATAWLPAHFPSWSVLHYHIFYLSAFASLKNGAIHCCCSSCLAKMAQQIVKRMNRPADSETNSSLWGESTLHLSAFSVFLFLPQLF